jgi:hypothetical protein
LPEIDGGESLAGLFVAREKSNCFVNGFLISRSE